MAAMVVRPSLAIVRVFSRNAQNRERFAADMSQKLGRQIVPAATAKEAVAGADLVVCATDSSVPVIDTAWLKPGAHVTTIGPKLADEHELPPDIGHRAAVIATDSPDQILSSHGVRFFLQDTPAWDRMTDLADIVAGRTVGRHSTADLTLFCSVGLAGTEVVIGNAILRRAGAIRT
jgi:ornithine cyclodeaminase